MRRCHVTQHPRPGHTHKLFFFGNAASHFAITSQANPNFEYVGAPATPRAFGIGPNEEWLPPPPKPSNPHRYEIATPNSQQRHIRRNYRRGFRDVIVAFTMREGEGEGYMTPPSPSPSSKHVCATVQFNINTRALPSPKAPCCE